MFDSVLIISQSIVGNYIYNLIFLTNAYATVGEESDVRRLQQATALVSSKVSTKVLINTDLLHGPLLMQGSGVVYITLSSSYTSLKVMISYIIKCLLFSFKML